MEENKAIFTKVGSTSAKIMRYDELRLDYTIPAKTTIGILKPDTLDLHFYNAEPPNYEKKNGQLQLKNSTDRPQTGILYIRGKITEIDLPGITNWITDVYGYKDSIKIRAPYLTKYSLPNNPKTVKLNLDDLLVFEKLMYLDLSGDTAVTGDIKRLSRLLGSLKTILLSDTKITGDIRSLNSTHRLAQLNLHNTSVTGDISQLGEMRMLEKLDLSQTLIDGDISSLRNLHSLKALDLIGTKVTGDAKVFVDNMLSLSELRISNTVTITDEQKKTLTDRGCTVTIA